MAAPSPAPPAGAPLLSVRDAEVAYPGGVVALHGVSLEVRAGEAVALVGANGAGKTTLLKAVAGLLAPQADEIWFDIGSGRQEIRRGGLTDFSNGTP